MGGLMAGAIGALEKRAGARNGPACAEPGRLRWSPWGVSMAEWQMSQAEQPPAWSAWDAAAGQWPSAAAISAHAV